MYNGHIQFLKTLDSLYSKGLKCLTLLIIDAYTLACAIFKIYQYFIYNYKPLNIIYTSFIFNISYIFIIVRANGPKVCVSVVLLLLKIQQ